MAELYALRALTALLAGTLFAPGTGCQAQKPVSMVEPLPPPNFGGPPSAAPVHLTTEPPAPRPERIASLPKAVSVAVAPSAAVVPAGIPREWVPIAPLNRWDYIVIHHSATTVGGAARFDRDHRSKGWDELGYHFVVGNGTDTAVGAVEVGSRWPKQKWGAHAKTPDERFNQHGIGICMVGNFDQTRPSEAQLKSLSKLVAYLMKTYHIPPDHVIGHGDTKATDCPGRYVSLPQIRRMCTQALLAEGTTVPESPEPARVAAGREMLANRVANGR